MLVTGIIAMATMIVLRHTWKALLFSDPMGFVLQLLGYFCTWLSLRPIMLWYRAT
jgi:hypothetical protein